MCQWEGELWVYTSQRTWEVVHEHDHAAAAAPEAQAVSVTTEQVQNCAMRETAIASELRDQMCAQAADMLAESQVPPVSLHCSCSTTRSRWSVTS